MQLEGPLQKVEIGAHTLSRDGPPAAFTHCAREPRIATLPYVKGREEKGPEGGAETEQLEWIS